jgi:hypothetical protein
MGDTKTIVKTKKYEDSKLTRKVSSLELENIRGYTLKPDSTFHQTSSSNFDSFNNASSTFDNTNNSNNNNFDETNNAFNSTSNSNAMNKTLNKSSNKHFSSTRTLPPLSRVSQHIISTSKLSRNYSSTM